MCTGLEAVLSSTAFQVGSLAVSALGTLASASAQSKAAKRDAAIAQQRANLQAAEDRREGQLRIKAQEAAFGKSGAAMDGTPVDVLAETAEDAEFNALLALHGGNLEAQSRLAEAKAARTAGMFGAATTILGGASKFGKGTSGTAGGARVGASVSTSKPWKAYPDFVGP